MRIANIILYFFAANKVFSLKFYQENYVDRSIEKFLRSIVRQDVIIKIQKRDIYSEHLLDLVAQSVITTWPTQIFVFGSDIQLWDKASSSTLLIYVWNDDITYAELNVSVTDIYSISYAKDTPKLLLIMDSNEHTLNAKKQLEYLWELKLLDVIILEVSFRSKHSELTFVALHRFDGFGKNYVRLTAYDDSIDWYPKSRNIYGDTFKVKFEEIWSPYGSLESETHIVGGLAKAFSDALSFIINGTVVHTDSVDESNMIYKAELKYDTKYDHSIAAGEDRICLLIPILPAKVLIDFWPIIVTILMGILLAAIMWCVSTILRVSERVRDPLNTISLILGFSPHHSAQTLVEKMLFVATVMTAAEYTIMFQAELFEFVIEFAVQIRVSSFEDLFATGLQVVAAEVIYEELVASEDLPAGLTKRFTSIGEKDRISVDTSTARAYFTTEMDGKLVETTVLGRSGERLFKVSDLCIISHFRVHKIPLKSAFKNEINRALLTIMENGLAEKHEEDFWKDIVTRKENEIILSDHSIYVAFLVIIVGYAISLVVFAGELIASRVLKREHSLHVK